MNAHTTDSFLSLSIQAGSFTSSQNVTVNQAPLSSLQGGAPSGMTPVAGFGVNFNGAAPTTPATLSISNKAIPASALVYKVLSSGMWMPVPAKVNNGRLSVPVTGAQDIVIANPNLPSNQRQILWNGQREQVAHALLGKDPVHGNMTTFMPIWYLMQILKQQGITSSWNGKVWNMSTSGSPFTPSLTGVSPGQGTSQIVINGQLVQSAYSQVAVDPAHGNKTTYMPIYWVFKALSHLGIQSSWNGSSWSITTSSSSSTSTTTSSTSTSSSPTSTS